jgi:integrase
LARAARGTAIKRSYAEAAMRFMDEFLPTLKPESSRRYQSNLKMLNGHFSGLSLDQITPATVKAYIAARKRSGSAAKLPKGGVNTQKGRAISTTTIKRDIACLGSILTRCVEWGWLEANPLHRIGKLGLKESEERMRYLSKDEAAALIGAVSGTMQAIIIFTLETGCRKEEVLSLKWRQVDLLRMEIRLTETKSGKPRVIPLSDRAAAQISAQPRHITEPWVFHREGQRWTTIRGGFSGAMKRAKIEGFTFHDLRHTFASWAVQGLHEWQSEPMDLYRLSKWLGHSTPRMTQRYAHLEVTDLHRAIKRKDPPKPAQKPAQDQGTATKAAG